MREGPPLFPAHAWGCAAGRMAGYPWYSHTMQKRRLGRSDLYLTPLGVSEGKNGYVYPKGEVERLAQILKLIHDPRWV